MPPGGGWLVFAKIPFTASVETTDGGAISTFLRPWSWGLIAEISFTLVVLKLLNVLIMCGEKLFRT